ncbi:DUF2269 family protein [Pelagibius sp. Alg239-R121]|uniref:DUF2269 family protein n=1 Tax=Pelagibius sp. Alg239-R121 TaxID=2993448 RepID=UPI0024A68054|nr:DUF2269 family protein [Pelagibius sp. Alg239-R121]
MDTYTLLKFGHIIGFILLGGGLLAVFVSEYQAYRTNDMKAFAEAARYTAIFYDSIAVPGALLVGVTGFFLILELGLGFFEEPWVVGMWALFLFEFIEGNTITRLQFRRTLRHSRDALENGAALTDDIRDDARSLLNQIVHFLDVPLFTVIVYCGTVRPDSWAHVLTAFVIGVSVAGGLTILVPRLARRNAS